MRRSLLLCAAAALAACGDLGSPSRQLQIVLTASPSAAAVGDSITFVATAQGSGLFGVEMTYGDGGSDVYNTGGATTAQIAFKHAYQAAGTFQVQATATDSRAGARSTSLSVSIQ